MRENPASRASAFLVDEYRNAAAAADAGQFDLAWHHLERAHIVAQTQLWPHCQSHWRMLDLAFRLHDWREAGGQVARLVLAPLGNLTGRLPVGNTGRSNVSAFAAMATPPDIQAILDPTFD